MAQPLYRALFINEILDIMVLAEECGIDDGGAERNATPSESSERKVNRAAAEHDDDVGTEALPFGG